MCELGETVKTQFSFSSGMHSKCENNNNNKKIKYHGVLTIEICFSLEFNCLGSTHSD